jgi:phospholipid/cholesterol/gamma-HCH transport system substrate-binding protein
LRFLDHLEIHAGGDDLLNAAATRNLAAPLSRGYTLGGRDGFLGGGFYFTDDDLKAVLSVAPKP